MLGKGVVFLQQECIHAKKNKAVVSMGGLSSAFLKARRTKISDYNEHIYHFLLVDRNKQR